MWLALGLGVLLAIILIVIARPFLGLFGPEADVLEQSVRYLRSSSFGLPGMLLVLAATGTLRGMGDTKTPLYISFVCISLNIILAIVLSMVLDMGAYGLAWAQSIVAVVEVTILFTVMSKRMPRLFNK